MILAGGMSCPRRVFVKALRLLVAVVLLLLLLEAPHSPPNSSSNASRKNPGLFTSQHGASGSYQGGILMASAAPRSKDYYQLLGVRRNASQRTIDKAYRKLAKKLHPDIAPGKEKEFMEIAKAHEVLSDPEQRKKYDAFGEEGVAALGGAGGAEQGFPFDLFADLLGRAGGGGFAGFSGQGGAPPRGGGGGKGTRMKFEFSKEIPDYMKGFGFGQQQQQSPEEEDWDADLYGDVPLVLELNPDNYKRALAERGDLLIVEIYNPHCGPCRDFKAEYAVAAQRLENVVPFAAVNCRTHRKLPLCRLGKRYPSVLIYGPDKESQPSMYTGKKKFEELLSFIGQQVAQYLTELTHINIEDWLTRNPGKPKIILFARIRSLPPEWAIGAFRFKSQMDIGIIYPNEKKLISDYFTEPTEFNNGKFVPYLQVPSLLKISDLDTLNGEWRKIRGISADQFISLLGLLGAQSRVPTASPLHPLTTRRMRAEECTTKDSQFCFILLLPNKTAAWGSARSVYSAMKELAAKYKTDPVKLVYVDAEKNPDFAAAFGYSPGSKKELLVAYRPKRKRFLAVGPPLDKESVEELIDKVLAGTQLPEALKQTPMLSGNGGKMGKPSHDEL